MAAAFAGGVRLREHKGLARASDTGHFLPKGGELIFPLAQHIGASSIPVVRVGEAVRAGQLLAEADGNVSANVISSVSGRVQGITDRPSVGSKPTTSVVIENDGLYSVAADVGTVRDPERLSRDEIIALIRRAGIVGMGGAGFPTHVKLTPKQPDAIDTIIVNACECEPYLISDERAVTERTEALLEGALVLLQLFPNARCVIAIEDDKPEAIERAEHEAAGHDKVSVLPVTARYPQGAERALVYAVTGRKLNSRLLPADAGCIVDNAETVIAIADAVVRGLPLMGRYVTVSGAGVAVPQATVTPLGVSFADLIAFSGGAKPDACAVIAGGPMMGNAAASLSAPVTKTTSGLICLTSAELAGAQHSSCIRCSRCAAVCPARLMPMLLKRYADRGDSERFIDRYGMECIECGCCSYICPARLPLTEAFRGAKRRAKEHMSCAKAGAARHG